MENSRGGLTEKFAQLQSDGRSHTSVALEVFRDIFFPEPPPPPSPTRLKIFAAGLPRSGTGSLAVALTRLGYTPCHGPGTFELAPVFATHYEGRASNSDIVRHQEELGFDAQGFDPLGWKLWREAAVVPDARVILTEHPRGAEGWAESYTSFAPDHIHHFSQRPFSFMESMVQMMTLSREFLSYISALGDGGMATSDPRDPVFSFPGTALASSYERHREAVIAGVPEDRLLVFDPRQGWEPLCEFLRIERQTCPVDTEYPRMTNRRMMMTMSRAARAVTWTWPIAAVAVISAVAWIGRRCCLRLRRKKKVA